MRVKGNPAFNYLRNRIETATPQQLTLMLLEGACRFAVLAQQSLESKEYVSGNHNTQRCQMILEELMITLDFAAGPVANNLFSVYEYLNRLLIQANVQKNPAVLLEVIDYLNQLRECWKEAMGLAKGGGEVVR